MGIVTWCTLCVNYFFRYFQKYFCRTNVRLFLCLYSPVFKIQTYVRLSVKWEKTDVLRWGRTKNQNVCSVFPTAYKLVHLYTNFILKPLNKNPIKPSKIKHFTHFKPKTLISHPISSNPTKINTFFTHHTTQIQPQFKQLSSYINTKILRKSIFLPITSFAPKIKLIFNSKREINNVTKFTTKTK